MTQSEHHETEIEKDLRRAISALLSNSCDAPLLDACFSSSSAHAGQELWRSIRLDLGVAGVLADPENDGASRYAIAAAILQELGRAVAPVPFLTSSVIATETLSAVADAARLDALASGDATAAVLAPWSATSDSLTQTFSVRSDSSGRLYGAVRGVAGALEASHLIVPAAGSETTPRMFVVENPSPALRIDACPSLDMTRTLAVIELDGVVGDLVAEGDEMTHALRAGWRAGSRLLASEQLGVSDSALTMTLDHVTQRSQFGRTLGSFQAIKHRLADLWVEVENLRSIAREAAVGSEGDEPELLAALAQAYASDVAVRVAEDALQMHGGIGMTWEHPLHYRLKRAKSDQIAMGSAWRHRQALAPLIDLPISG